jgi:hypothetical protein
MNQPLGSKKKIYFNDKIYAESSTENTPNSPKFIRPICPIGPQVWDIVGKRHHWASVIRVPDHHQQLFANPGNLKSNKSTSCFYKAIRIFSKLALLLLLLLILTHNVVKLFLKEHFHAKK